MFVNSDTALSEEVVSFKFVEIVVEFKKKIEYY